MGGFRLITDRTDGKSFFIGRKEIIKKMIKENSYINIQAFMVNELHLKGNELLIYAIIWGFSQDGESQFTGSLQYLADWTCSTKQGVIKALQSLCEKQLILKNVEYKNNIRFCTYKSMVLNKVEQGSKQSLMGYETEFNGGIKQSLPNNKNNILNNKQEYNSCVPDYIQKEIDKTKVISMSNVITDIYEIIKNHNQDSKKKIPVSKDVFSFQCKEGRMLSEILNGNAPQVIINALKNYLSVANMDSWKTSFSFNAFCKNYIEYTDEFFDVSKYDKETDTEKICDNFIKQMEKVKGFDTGAFWQNRMDWLEKGRPQGEKYFQWQEEKYKEMGL